MGERIGESEMKELVPQWGSRVVRSPYSSRASCLG